LPDVEHQELADLEANHAARNTNSATNKSSEALASEQMEDGSALAREGSSSGRV
jgi:hypothetical protein